MIQKLKIALPTGSLNDTARGNTNEFFKTAGYDIEGYEPKKETKPIVLNQPFFDVTADRPQDMPRALSSGIYDVAILGSDWKVESREELVEVLDLKYGNVRIVAAQKPDEKATGLDSLLWRYSSDFSVSTEYPTIAADYVKGSETYKKLFGNADPVIVYSKDQRKGTNLRVKIFPSAGRTEMKIVNSSANLIVEAAQTGETIRRAGLVEIDEIMKSSARLYATKATLDDGWKRGQIEGLAAMLYGAVRAREDYFLVAMNVPEEKMGVVAAYLKKEGLCGKEPTVSMPFGGNVAVEAMIPKAVYPKTIGDLLRLKADDIINITTGQIVKPFTYGDERK